jgi:hypothetical protein
MTPPYAADDVVDMTPQTPEGDPQDAQDVMDLTPYSADGEMNGANAATGMVDTVPLYTPDDVATERSAMPQGDRSYPGREDIPGENRGRGEQARASMVYGAYGEPPDQYGMAAPSPSRPQPAPWEEKRPKVPLKGGGTRWKLGLAALAGLIVAALAFKVLGQSVGIGGSPSAQSTAIPSTGTPGVTSTQPDTTTGPLILLNPGVVRQGAALAVMGSGFDPGATVDLTLKRQASGKALATGVAKADQSGFFGDAAITVPQTLSAGNFVVEAHERNTTKTVRAVGTIAGGAPQVKLGTMVGKPGDLIVVTLHGFAPEEPVNVYWNTLSGDPVTQLKADGGGTIGQAKIRVPFGAIGDNTFLFVGATSQSMVAANFLVLKMYPTIKLSSYALRADSVMSFSGSGFGPSERVLVFLNSPNSAPVAVVPTDPTGSFKNTTGFVVPFTITGKQTLIFMGEQSRTPNQVAFTVMPYSPIVEPSTYGGFPGTTITFFGTGFARNEVVHILAGYAKGGNGKLVGCFQADDKGNAAAVGSYLIPGDAQGTLGFALVGQKSHGVGVASIKVNAPPAPVHTPPQAPFTCPLDAPAQQPQTPQAPPQGPQAPPAPGADLMPPGGPIATRPMAPVA